MPDPETEDEYEYEDGYEPIQRTYDTLATSLADYNRIISEHLNHCPSYMDTLLDDDVTWARLGVRCGCGFRVQVNIAHARNSELTRTMGGKIRWLDALKERARHNRETYVPTAWERLLRDN